MATSRQIHVRVDKYNNIPMNGRDICISIDDIVWVEDTGSVRKLHYERNRDNGLMCIMEVQETLQDILNDADNSGYTEHGLKQATLLKFNNTNTKQKQVIFNRGGQRTEHEEPIDGNNSSIVADATTGTFIRYRSRNHSYPDEFYVAEDLCGVTEPSAS